VFIENVGNLVGPAEPWGVARGPGQGPVHRRPRRPRGRSSRPVGPPSAAARGSRTGGSARGAGRRVGQ
jgi:hypothetical protein